MREYSVFDKDKAETSYLRSLRGMFDVEQRLSIDKTLQADGQWENEFFVIRSVSGRKETA